MRKFLITFLGVVFLLPAFAYAGNYCVSFPTDGNSRWSRRDNGAVAVKFTYSYKVVHEKGMLNGFSTVSGNIRGDENKSYEYDVGYKWWNFGTKDICLDTSKLSTDLQWFVDNAAKQNHGIIFPDNAVATVNKVWLDVKWGGDCTKKTASGNHNFVIYRRKGDHINPWGCGSR